MEDIIIKQVELKKDIEEIINKAQLPAFVLVPIVKDLLAQLSIAEVQQYNQALKTKEETKEKKKK